MPEKDYRYRILVNLVRTDRPRYWSWYCPHCQRKLVEMANVQPISMTDVVDMNNMEKALIGLRCSGRSPTGYGRCDFWYYFDLAEKPPKVLS